MISISEEIDRLTYYALLEFIFQLLLRKSSLATRALCIIVLFSDPKNINHSDLHSEAPSMDEALIWGLGLEPNSWHPVSRGVVADRPLIHDGQSSWGPYCLSAAIIRGATVSSDGMSALWHLLWTCLGGSSVTPYSSPLYMHRRYYLWLTGFEGALHVTRHDTSTPLSWRGNRFPSFVRITFVRVFPCPGPKVIDET
jgi:hypothetical protein